MADKPSKSGWDAARAASGFIVSHPEARRGKPVKKAKTTKKKGSEARRRSRESEQRTAESIVYESDPSGYTGYASERRPPEGVEGWWSSSDGAGSKKKAKKKRKK